MVEHKHYTDIVRYGHKSTQNVLKAGDYITVTEKLDGANVSFMLDGNEVKCFSRNTIVDETNTFRGFYQWVQENIVPIKEKLIPCYRYFGEWLVPHTVKYKPEFYHNIYLFNVYCEQNKQYLIDSITFRESKRLNVNIVPTFYEGVFISFEHLLSFVGKSDMALEHGEGIVVKNVGFVNEYGNQLFVKLVHDKFIEVCHQKKPKNPDFKTVEMEFVEKCLTKARVEKMLHKLVDERVLPEEIGIEDMGLILKSINERLYLDIMKEEGEELSLIQYEDKDIRKSIGKRAPFIIKDILATRI